MQLSIPLKSCPAICIELSVPQSELITSCLIYLHMLWRAHYSLSLRCGKAGFCSAARCSYGPFMGAAHLSFASLPASKPAMTRLPQSSPGTALSAAFLFCCIGFIQCCLPNLNHLLDLPLVLSPFQALIPTPELYFPGAAKAHSCFLRRVALHKRQLPNPRRLHCTAHTHTCNQLHINQDLR